MADGARGEDTAQSGWNFDDPAGLTEKLESLTASFSECRELEPVQARPPFSRTFLAGLGLTGVEFASYRTEHPTGLASNVVPFSSPSVTTEKGVVYLVDKEKYFIELDVAEPLPFEDGSLEWVYAEHLIEHVPVSVAIPWLREVRRALVPGGLLRLTTPDLARYAEAYVTDNGFLDSHRRRMRGLYSFLAAGAGAGPVPPIPRRPAFLVNQIFYLYGHKWIYDKDELAYVLEAAGFGVDTMRVCAFHEGADPAVARLDIEARSDETLYVEVTAPSTPA